MSVTPEDSERRAVSQESGELTPQQTQERLASIMAGRLELYLEPLRQKLGKPVTLEALLLERDCPVGAFSDYNERTKDRVGQEYIYPLVSIAGEENWFILGGVGFSEPKKTEVANYALSKARGFVVNWENEKGVRFYFDFAKLDWGHWWSVDQRVFMRDGDDDIIPAGVTRLAPGYSTVKRLLDTTRLSGLFKEGEFTDAFLGALDRAALTPTPHSNAVLIKEKNEILSAKDYQVAYEEYRKSRFSRDLWQQYQAVDFAREYLDKGAFPSEIAEHLRNAFPSLAIAGLLQFVGCDLQTRHLRGEEFLKFVRENLRDPVSPYSFYRNRPAQ